MFEDDSDSDSTFTGNSSVLQKEPPVTGDTSTEEVSISSVGNLIFDFRLYNS